MESGSKGRKLTYDELQRTLCSSSKMDGRRDGEWRTSSQKADREIDQHQHVEVVELKGKRVCGLPAQGEGCSMVVLSSGVGQLGSFAPDEGIFSVR